MKFILAMFMFQWLVVAAFAETAPFQLAGETIAPGTSLDLNIKVPAGKNDPATHIPVTVMHSDKEGPVLLVITGVHGYEFPPILAAKQLASDITPNDLSGTLILVRAAHISAFEERSPFVNPYDRKNLNRSFPGKKDGTQTERIAYYISTELIDHADIVLDVHAGDGGEWLEPFIGVYGGPLSTNPELAHEMASVSGFEHLVTYSIASPRAVGSTSSLNRQAVVAKKPTLLIEAGQNSSRDPKYVQMHVRAVKNIMVHLEMLGGAFQSRAATSVKDYDGEFSIPSPAAGIWMPEVTSGRHIAKNQIIGRLYDYFGKEIALIRSPKSGFAIYGQVAPSVKKGQGLIFMTSYRNRTE